MTRENIVVYWFYFSLKLPHLYLKSSALMMFVSSAYSRNVSCFFLLPRSQHFDPFGWFFKKKQLSGQDNGTIHRVHGHLSLPCNRLTHTLTSAFFTSVDAKPTISWTMDCCCCHRSGSIYRYTKCCPLSRHSPAGETHDTLPNDFFKRKINRKVKK